MQHSLTIEDTRRFALKQEARAWAASGRYREMADALKARRSELAHSSPRR